MFTHREPSIKLKVRGIGNDIDGQVSHTVNMANRRKPRSIEILEDLHRTSGWYLGAWRDYRGLTLDDVAAEIGSSKSAVSELESGRPRKDGSIPRFNKDTLEAVANALNVTRGHLLEVNPFTAEPEFIQIQDKMRGLDSNGRTMALRLISQLEPADQEG